MPKINAVVCGRTLAFAPLKLKELRQLYGELDEAKLAGKIESGTLAVDLWLPYIKISIERAGGEMPDFDDLAFDEADREVTAAIKAVLSTCKNGAAPSGETKPSPETRSADSTVA